LGSTPFTAHTALPVPCTTSLDTYLANPSTYKATDFVGIVEEAKVAANTHGGNITRVRFTTIGYGEVEGEKRNGFDNRGGGEVGAVEVFLRKETWKRTARTADKVLRSSGGASEEGEEEEEEEEEVEGWALVWWQIVPMALIHGQEHQPDSSSLLLPSGLEDWLLVNETRQGAEKGNAASERGKAHSSFGKKSNLIHFFALAGAIALGLCFIAAIVTGAMVCVRVYRVNSGSGAGWYSSNWKVKGAENGDGDGNEEDTLLNDDDEHQEYGYLGGREWRHSV